MYRKTIDHPQYLPEAVRASADFDSGKDKGRVYRIVPERISQQSLDSARKPMLGRVNTSELCAKLGSSNGWVRSTAFRLLLERKDKSMVAVLSSLVRNGDSLLPQGRVAALWLLDSVNELDQPALEGALVDAHPGVREQAIQLVQARFSSSLELTSKVLVLGADLDPRVRFQSALALGESSGPNNMKVLAEIAARDGADIWARAAVLSSMRDRAEDFFQALTAVPPNSSEGRSAVMADLSYFFGLSQPPEKCLAFLNHITTNLQDSKRTWQFAAVKAVAEGLRSRGLARNGLSPLRSLVSDDSAEAVLGRSRLDELNAAAIETARNSSCELKARVLAVALIGEVGADGAESSLLSLLVPEEPIEIQAAAARACGQLPDLGPAKAMVARQRWRAYLPPVREAVLEVLMSEPRYLPILLDGLERGEIQSWTIEPARRRQLMQHKDETIRRRATALFKVEGSGDRQKAYEDCKSVLNLTANAGNGHEVFKKICAQCHAHSGEGFAVGPDLSGVHNQPPEALLLHIIIPSYEIVPGYTSYNIETKDGRVLTGLIASETATSITLKRSLGATDSIFRTNIAILSSSGVSLMPDELEKTMTRQELADLIAFLKGR
jgi:putative heme-binding domain-containing protein